MGRTSVPVRYAQKGPGLAAWNFRRARGLRMWRGGRLRLARRCQHPAGTPSLFAYNSAAELPTPKFTL